MRIGPSRRPGYITVAAHSVITERVCTLRTQVATGDGTALLPNGNEHFNTHTIQDNLMFVDVGFAAHEHGEMHMKNTSRLAGTEVGTIVFDDRPGRGDDHYHEWLATHPEGWVVNTRRRLDTNYMVLHRATCPTIRSAARSSSKNPFTGENYIKICSDDVSKLNKWVVLNGGYDFSKRCARCNA